MKAKDNRIMYADILRVFATFAVVVLHVSAQKWYETPVKNYDWLVFNFYDSLVRWAVPVFVMLSGIFFLNPEKEISIKKIYRKYIFRILVSLVFWGLFYQLFDIFAKFLLKKDPITLEKIVMIFIKVPFGPAWYHLWYLYMLIGLYLLTPLYRIFTYSAKKEDLEYLLILFFLFGILLPFCNKIFLRYDSRLNISFHISELVNYTGYYFAGFYFSKFSLSKKKKNILYCLGFSSFLFTVVGTSCISLKTGFANDFLYGNLAPTTMFEAFSVFLFMKSICKQEYSKIISDIVLEISNCSFGIYLIHDFIKIILFQIGITSNFINSVFAVPLSSISIFLISLFIIYFVRKIPLCKYIM